MADSDVDEGSTTDDGVTSLAGGLDAGGVSGDVELAAAARFSSELTGTVAGSAAAADTFFEDVACFFSSGAATATGAGSGASGFACDVACFSSVPDVAAAFAGLTGANVVAATAAVVGSTACVGGWTTVVEILVEPAADVAPSGFAVDSTAVAFG